MHEPAFVHFFRLDRYSKSIHSVCWCLNCELNTTQHVTGSYSLFVLVKSKKVHCDLGTHLLIFKASQVPFIIQSHLSPLPMLHEHGSFGLQRIQLHKYTKDTDISFREHGSTIICSLIIISFWDGGTALLLALLIIFCFFYLSWYQFSFLVYVE